MAALLTSQDLEEAEMLINRQGDKKAVAHICNKISLGHSEKVKCYHLGQLGWRLRVLCSVKYQSAKDKYNMISLICGI